MKAEEKKIEGKIEKRLEECVNDAIESGKHDKFADFFINETRSYSEIYESMYSCFVERLPREERNVSNWTILNADDFLNPKIGIEECRKVNNKTISSWKMRSADKYYILQVGIYLRLKSYEINEFLICSGNEQLYPVNLVDAICLFHLRKNEGSSESLSPRRLIMAIKESINQYVVSEGACVNFRKKYKSDEESIRNYLAKVCSNDLVSPDDQKKMADFITKYYKRENDPERYELDEFLNNRSFTECRIAFSKMTEKFLESNAFLKNLILFPYKAVSSLSVDQLREIRDGHYRNQEYLNSDLDLLLKARSKSGISETDTIRCMRTIFSISNSKISFLRNGRRGSSVGFPETGRAVRDPVYVILDGERTVNRTYIQPRKHSLKQHMMMMCLAAGYEDYLGRYLELGNMWMKNWINRGYPDNRILEETDAIVIYAMRYRDRLIEEWAAKMEVETDITSLKISLKKNFPMVWLIYDIEYDISNKINKNCYGYAKEKSFLFWN